jgi:hypothetical protein
VITALLSQLECPYFVIAGNSFVSNEYDVTCVLEYKLWFVGVVPPGNTYMDFSTFLKIKQLRNVYLVNPPQMLRVSSSAVFPIFAVPLLNIDGRTANIETYAFSFNATVDVRNLLSLK